MKDKGLEGRPESPSVSQDDTSKTAASELVAPRLQLRWAHHEGESRFGDTQPEWDCHYELVIPLREHDIRREIYDDDGDQIGERSEIIVPLKGRTIRGADVEPCWDRFASRWYADPPFRDASHAAWDAAVLGGLPVYVIAIDGRAFLLSSSAELSDAKQSSGTNQ